MRTILKLLLLSAVWLAPLPAMAGTSDDTVTLMDGRVLTGTVVEETKDRLTLQVQGVNRLYDRSLVKSIQYGTGPEPAASTAQDNNTVPTRITSKAATLDQDLADRYQVPLKEVVWVRHQGISDADLPMVFFVASQAQVRP
ncbi:MAG TPA: hypothetical protein VNZ67_04640, partial [bacterium]|nr:hypothetical protein [bacterium]